MDFLYSIIELVNVEFIEGKISKSSTLKASEANSEAFCYKAQTS